MMAFRIADPCTASLARLTGAAQKAVKVTAFDGPLNPAPPGMPWHKLDPAREPPFWAGRVRRDRRVRVHQTDARLLLGDVDHPDQAYRWAERRTLATPPRTGAAPVGEIREAVQAILVPTDVAAAPPAPPNVRRFAHVAEAALLSSGGPAEWGQDGRQATAAPRRQVADHLPSEAAEARRDLATGGKPPVTQRVAAVAEPCEHPDAQRRFRGITKGEELARALESPWEKRTRRRRVRRHAPRRGARLDVQAMNARGRRLDEWHVGRPHLASRVGSPPRLAHAARAVAAQRFRRQFLRTAWEEVVDAWQLDPWEADREGRRVGRKTRLPEPPRAVRWAMLARVRSPWPSRGCVTDAGMFTRRAVPRATRPPLPCDGAVVDDAQAVSGAPWRALAAVGADHPNDRPAPQLSTPAALDRAWAAVAHAGVPCTGRDEPVETTSGHGSSRTRPLATGLEFRAVAVMAYDDEIIPRPPRIETVADDADREAGSTTDRHRLDVACTRARDHRLVTSVAPPSAFLDDLQL
jgi:hypothetical protein